ncbi:hypothetical protein D5R40_24390 [Okeania hirsuta]|uniref:Uncharacterized protein n=1 Tax=Okeania hirsuta TaxID=1458930 RepID=A0A3N6RH08_9CYAN|nr:hypothetical protein D4Z78_29315 [Okeania hirsuta]RQH29724.1 hypothetical protein D5R40_24390 [Okeania hirsuta]
MILNNNQDYCGITLLINHLIADGGTYFKLLEYLSRAYEYPGYVPKSEPLFTIYFNNIDNFISVNFKKLSWKEKLLSSTSFIVFILNSFLQNKNNWSYLECILTKEKLDLIKRRNKNLSNEEIPYSTNDALFEFLSVVPIKRFFFPCNLRYRNVGIPENYLGNAEALVLDLTKPENNYMLNHTDVRKSVNLLPRIYSFVPTFDGKYMGHNSWVKLQNYLPGFGGKLILQKFFEFDDIPKDLLSFAVKGSMIYRLTKNEYLLIYINLKNVVSQVEKKLINLGVEEIIIKTS